MNLNKLLNKAIVIVTTEFDGIYDAGGTPYSLHCLQVMNGCTTNDMEVKIAAVLHDLVEDNKKTKSVWTFTRLRDEGFSKRIVDLLQLLTHKEDESYEDYINKVDQDDDAVSIKLSDLRHNMDPTRLKGLTDKDFARMEKYQKAYFKLYNR